MTALRREPAALTAKPPAAVRVARRWRALANLGWQPIVVAVGCGVLYAWVHSLTLDEIERQVLNQSFVTDALVRQVTLSVVSAVLILAIAIPAGVLLSRPWARPAAPFVLGLGNVGQAFPAVGLLVLLAVKYGIGFTIAVIAFTAYGILPTLRNTLVGLRQIDHTTVTAARGMGMTSWQTLRKIELPLSVPVILAGVRTTLILTVGVATLGTFVNAGGLGDVLVAGLKLNRMPVIVTGTVLTAAVALAIDWTARVADQLLRPRGL